MNLRELAQSVRQYTEGADGSALIVLQNPRHKLYGLRFAHLTSVKHAA
jgi:hypothetical protein